MCVPIGFGASRMVIGYCIFVTRSIKRDLYVSCARGENVDRIERVTLIYKI